MLRRATSGRLVILALAALLALMPLTSFAEEEAAPAPETEESAPEPEPEPPKATYTVHYDPNEGTGDMENSTFTEGEDAALRRCTFTRSGYTFEGWTTEADGGGKHFADGTNIRDALTSDMTLYAQWGSQIYLIRYAPGKVKTGETVEGEITTQLAVHDAEVLLMPALFTREGYTIAGWMDAEGKVHEPESYGTNFVAGTDTTSWKVATLDVEQVRPDSGNKWSCQGSVVFRGEDGATCAAVGFINYDDVYRKGSLDNYDSTIIVANLDTGEIIKSNSGLMLEHANDIAYRPDNGHFYVVQGGLHDGFPGGIVELDENLNEVRTVTPEGTHHIWNISYSDGVFYAIGNVDGTRFARGNPNGETSDLIRLDNDLNVIDMHAIDYSPQGFSGQGMVCDGTNLYAILINFAEHESGSKQRLSIYTIDGEPRGTQRIDITSEVESASWLDGHMYFSTNGGSKCTIFGTDLASTTMTPVWEPNPYTITFDGNSRSGVVSIPADVAATYDTLVQLPKQVPTSAGQEFAGWNTAPDGSGTAYAPGDTVENLASSGTVTLYAQWKIRPVALVGDNGRRVRARRRGPAHLRQAGRQARHSQVQPNRRALVAGALVAQALVAVGLLHRVAWQYSKLSTRVIIRSRRVDGPSRYDARNSQLLYDWAT